MMAGNKRQRSALARSRTVAPFPTLLIAVLGCLLAPGNALAAPAPAAAEKPNIVVVMADDQDAASMPAMPQASILIGSRGVTFTESIATNPVCCPSRSTFLTGRYSHTTGIFRNSPPHGGETDFDDAETLPVWLQRAGYETALIGKYMNGYGRPDPTLIPPGWSWWEAMVDPTTYRMYGYTINENGNLVTYGDYNTPDPALYQTDVLAQKAVDYIERQAGSSSPFFLTVTPLAPHTEVFKRPQPGEDDAAIPSHPNPRAAPRHVGSFAHLPLPRDPNFNERNISDKSELVRSLPRMTPFFVRRVTWRHRARLESLLALDDMVASIVAALRRSGELENTIILYTSDNGFQRGQHRIPNGKQMPYEESLRVPLLIRGPGIPRGELRRQLVGNIDLAPTIADWAGATPGRLADGTSRVDGTSLQPLIRNPRRELGRALVIENWCQTNEACFDPEIPRFKGVRTDRFSYISFPSGEEELYDLREDPFQLRSRHRLPGWRPSLDAARDLLAEIGDCAGEACLLRPRLRVRITARFGRLAGGRRCTGSAVTVRPAGAQRGLAIELEGRMRGRLYLDEDRPLRLRITRSQLKRRGKSRLRLRVTAADGRAVTVVRRLPRPC